MKEGSTIDTLLKDLRFLMEEGRWQQALVLLDEGLSMEVNHAVLRANRCVCNYHRGMGKELVAELDYLLGEWPSGISRRSLIVLGILCAHEARDAEFRDRLVLGLADEIFAAGLDAWGIPTMPLMIEEDRVLDTRSPCPLPDVLEAARENLRRSGKSEAVLDDVVARFREREILGASLEPGSVIEPIQVTASDPVAAGRFHQLLGALMEDYVDPASPVAHLRESPADLCYHLVEDLGFKMIYGGEGGLDTILLQVWNYDIPLPGEEVKTHQQLMEDWCRSAIEAGLQGGHERSCLPEPILVVDFASFGGVVARY